MIDFKDISYLKQGNPKQQKAFNTLFRLKIFEKLRLYTPVLTGTIPIEIDIDDSDLDIICFCQSLDQFKSEIIKFYGNLENFELQVKLIRDNNSVISRFTFDGFLFEIFGQNRPVEEQEAYKHMLIEYKVLQYKGEEFRQKIIELKKQGLKTEPAFAKLLGLSGDPYLELLKFGELLS